MIPATIRGSKLSVEIVVSGSVMASFQVEDFGLDRMRGLTHAEIDGRFAAFRELSSFDHGPLF